MMAYLSSFYGTADEDVELGVRYYQIDSRYERLCLKPASN